MTDRQRARTTIGLAGVLLLLVVVGVTQRGERLDTITSTRPLTLRIDPNTADADRLCLLPRIGPGIAERIVADREANGRFEQPADLERVRMIAAKTRDAFEPWIALSHPDSKQD